jgi:hypothetical protein
LAEEDPVVFWQEIIKTKQVKIIKIFIGKKFSCNKKSVALQRFEAQRAATMRKKILI